MIVKSAVKKSDPHMTLLMLVNLVENISSKGKKSCTLKKVNWKIVGQTFPFLFEGLYYSTHRDDHLMPSHSRALQLYTRSLFQKLLINFLMMRKETAYCHDLKPFLVPMDLHLKEM